MGDAIGDMLPSAVAVAVSPIPIIAVIPLLATPRARTNGPAFVIGWLLGIILLGGAVLLLASGLGASEDHEPATWVGLLKGILGLGLLLVALRQWQSRPGGDEADLPKWMATLDTFTPAKSLSFAALLSSLNPKNLVLVVAGATSIAQVGLPTSEAVACLVIFALIASIGVTTPVALFLVLGERSRETLDGVRHWFAQNNAVIMAAIFLILGAKLLGDAISQLL